MRNLKKSNFIFIFIFITILGCSKKKTGADPLEEHLRVFKSAYISEDEMKNAIAFKPSKVEFLNYLKENRKQSYKCRNLETSEIENLKMVYKFSKDTIQYEFITEYADGDSFVTKTDFDLKADKLKQIKMFDDIIYRVNGDKALAKKCTGKKCGKEFEIPQSKTGLDHFNYCDWALYAKKIKKGEICKSLFFSSDVDSDVYVFSKIIKETKSAKQYYFSISTSGDLKIETLSSGSTGYPEFFLIKSTFKNKNKVYQQFCTSLKSDKGK